MQNLIRLVVVMCCDMVMFVICLFYGNCSNLITESSLLKIGCGLCYMSYDQALYLYHPRYVCLLTCGQKKHST